MNTVPVLFNRYLRPITGSIEAPSVSEIKNTFGLWNASLDDAMRYGGELTRQSIRAMNLRYDRKHIIVDTKVHMLMVGMSPAIPGWHTDGAPRDNLGNPNGTGMPDTFMQETLDNPPRYHILVTGTGCLTKFINKPIMLDIPDKPSFDVYTMMSGAVNKMVYEDPNVDPNLVASIPSCTVMEFDWWDVHTGVIATKKEWRYLIRVTETDFLEPQKDLREVIRTQSQVYSPYNFGW